jgi:hypothetical protein
MAQSEQTRLNMKAVDQMDATKLAEIVSQALDKSVTVPEWQVRMLSNADDSTNPLAVGVYRVSGTAVTEANGSDHAWALILKILANPVGKGTDRMSVTSEVVENPRVAFFWKREALVGQSDLLSSLPPGLVAPLFYEATDLGNEIWLWQSEVVDDRDWTWADYEEAARRLGRWQGRPVQEPGVNYPFLTEDWLGNWVNLVLARLVPIIEELNAWQHPLATTYFSLESIARLQQLWREKEKMMAKLASLPKTFCHLDAYRSNFFWQGDTLTLIDWAFTGVGAVGEELAAFIGGTLLLGHVPVAEAEQLETVALKGYLAGLQEAGWDGDADQVWLAYQCSMPLRYALMAFANILQTALDPNFNPEHWEQKEGRPVAELLQQRADLTHFLLSRVPDFVGSGAN